MSLGKDSNDRTKKDFNWLVRETWFGLFRPSSWVNRTTVLLCLYSKILCKKGKGFKGYTIKCFLPPIYIIFLTFFLNFLDTNFLLSLCETENKNEWLFCFMASLNKLFKATVSLSTSTQNEREKRREQSKETGNFFSANLFPKEKWFLSNSKQFKATLTRPV